MAKKAKKTGFSIQGFDAAHYRQTEEYLRAIDAIYQQAVNDFALLGERLKIDPDKPFSLTDYPSANAKAQQEASLPIPLDVPAFFFRRYFTPEQSEESGEWIIRENPEGIL